MLGRISGVLDSNTAVTLYKTLILPIFDYCDYVYYMLNNRCRDMLQRLQNCALKNILQVNRRTPTAQIHTELEIPMLNVRRDVHVAEQMYKFVNKQGPPECCDMFTFVNETHQRNTRAASNLLLQVPKRRIKTTERGMRYFGPVTWNKVTLETRSSINLEAFKTQLRAEVYTNPP